MPDEKRKKKPKPLTYRGEPLKDYRYRALISEHFSPEEAKFYSERAIGGLNIRWLRRARIRFWSKLTPSQRDDLIDQVGEWYDHKDLADAELGEKRYSPRFEEGREEDRAEMLEFWNAAMGGTMTVRLHLK